MATLVSQRWQYALYLEKELKEELNKKVDLPLFEDVDNLINGLRGACEMTIFLDFEFATKEGVENHLWDAHVLINSRYRKLVTHYRNVEQKKSVERRKLEKRYVDFIKTSQFFYKGYIQRLASHFAGMKGLRRIAHRLSLQTLTTDQRVQVSSDVEHLIEMSCHATLLRLGDLSRYRNQLRTKDRSWEPALGYYGLAGDLYPDSGSSHNQMAVIALAELNHLDALYHLYRAIAVKEPHPLARGNLEIEFKKITTLWEKNSVSQTRNDSEATLILWFVRLHAKLYKGVQFSTHDELENEVLSRLVCLMKEQSFETTLEKFVLTNIAAEYLAAEKVQELNSATNVQSFYFLLRLNVRMLSALLQILQPELEDPVTGEDLPYSTDGSQPNSTRDKITVITRRILPALRQYSTWLVSEANVLVGTNYTPVKFYIKEMWKMYVDVLTGLANLFPVTDLPSINYLLEEDEATVGFKPLRDRELSHEGNLYTDEDGVMKPRSTDPGIERNHPNIEMQGRVRDILLCGLTLAVKLDNCPISLKKGTSKFVFGEEDLQHVTPAIAQGVASSHTTHISSHSTNPNFADKPHKERLSEGNITASDSQSMDTDLRRMVDDLLEPSSGRLMSSNETSYGMHSFTANEVFAPKMNSGFQSLPQTTPKVLPSLPGIWNSPFTPQPNELQLTSPDCPTTARQLSPFQLTTTQQRLEAAAKLDEMTGYGTLGINSLRPMTNLTSQPVKQTLPGSLNQQFQPISTSSSGFSDSSSIYANTPRGESRYGGGGALRTGPVSIFSGHNATVYAGQSDFDKTTMLQSSIWNGRESRWTYTQTPPGGQGG